jgi:cytochrome c-type biogenesis protein CcmH
MYLSGMGIWLLFALMTGAAVLAVLWPLSRRPDGAAEGDPEAGFYRDQLAEIDRDLARGLFSPAEAEAARAEAGRRLLRAAAEAKRAAEAVGEPALRRRRAASAIALSAVPLLALATYGAYGAPHLPTQPLSARLDQDPARLDLAAAVSRVEAHLAQHPEDGRGWEVIAPVYLRAGRVDDAVKAYAKAVQHLGESGPRLASLGEAMVIGGNGVVSAEARAVFERALKADGGQITARLFLALALEQDGALEAARARYAEILAASPPGASWTEAVRQRLARLPGGEAAAGIAALPDADRQEAIRGMVDGLAARLDAQGGSLDEWQRLIRSLLALGQPDRAAAALGKARTALAQDPAAAERLDALARDLGVKITENRP